MYITTKKNNNSGTGKGGGAGSLEVAWGLEAGAQDSDYMVSWEGRGGVEEELPGRRQRRW